MTEKELISIKTSKATKGKSYNRNPSREYIDMQITEE